MVMLFTSEPDVVLQAQAEHKKITVEIGERCFVMNMIFKDVDGGYHMYVSHPDYKKRILIHIDDLYVFGIE